MAGNSRMKLTEADVTKQCRGWLTARGWTGFRLQAGMVRGLRNGAFIRLSKANVQDWIFVRGREFFLLEMKATGKKPSKEQTAWARECDQKGLPNLWADSLESMQERARVAGIEI